MSIARAKFGLVGGAFLEFGLVNSLLLVAPVAPSKLSSESLLTDNTIGLDLFSYSG